MNARLEKTASNERGTNAFNGWLMIQLNLLLFVGAGGWLYWLLKSNLDHPGPIVIAPVLLLLAAFFYFQGLLHAAAE